MQECLGIEIEDAWRPFLQGRAFPKGLRQTLKVVERRGPGMPHGRARNTRRPGSSEIASIWVSPPLSP